MSDLDVHLADIVAGNRDAFAFWMAGAEPRVRDSLRSFAAAIDVEAVVQETLLRVWQVAPRFVPDGRADGLVRFAVRIARNLAVSEVRRTRATPVPDDELEAAAGSAVAAARDPMLRRAIVACRDLLPARPRRALDARLESAGGHDDGDLARALDMTLNTFLQNFTRARQLIAACLGKRGIAIDRELGA